MNQHKFGAAGAMFGDEEEGSVRAPDLMYYDTLVGGDESTGHDHSVSCCEVLCGRPRANEPKCNLLLCNVSRRVLKNMAMFVVVLILYILFLSVIMDGNRKQPST